MLIGLNLLAVLVGFTGSVVLERSAKIAAPAFEPPKPHLRDWPAHTHGNPAA